MSCSNVNLLVRFVCGEHQFQCTSKERGVEMVVNQHLLGEQEVTDLESGIIRIEHASQQNADKTNTQHHISRRGHFFQNTTQGIQQ